MANVDSPNGFLPYSGPGNGQAVVTYLDLSTSNSAIGKGDPVTHASGVVDQAAAAAALCGIAAEAKAANSGGQIAVWADPAQRFIAQTDDTTGTATALAGALNNCDFVTGTP